MALDQAAIETLKGVSTATLTTVLLKKGLRNVWMRGTKPLRPGQPRSVGPAFTFRFVPAREDLATPASWGSPISTRAAIEAMPEGAIAVIDGQGVTDAGVFGDILVSRMAKRGVAAMVTDGVVRDLAGVLGANFPVWCNGVAASPSVAGLTFVNWLLDEVLTEAPEQERMEAWIMEEVERGVALPGLYPMSAETKARYEAFKAGLSR
jgi:regulator of RNase E activity RraA